MRHTVDLLEAEVILQNLNETVTEVPSRRMDWLKPLFIS